jgi:putative membrane protein
MMLEQGPEMWIAHTIKSIIILALLVGGAILITRMIVNRPQGPATGTTVAPPTGQISEGPLRILEERFARGEIDEAEFRARRDTLRN